MRSNARRAVRTAAAQAQTSATDMNGKVRQMKAELHDRSASRRHGWPRLAIHGLRDLLKALSRTQGQCGV